MKVKKVGVLKGGFSSEREISLKTGEAVEEALKRLGFEVISIDVDSSIVKKILDEKIEVAFIALHGKYGEDGCIQGLLELLHIPYTGSKITASALALHKGLSKMIFKANNIPTPEFKLFKKGEKINFDFSYPIVVKPAEEGSTIGVSIVKEERNLKKAVDEAFLYGDEILIEKFIEGRDLTVGILEDKPLPPIEIRSKKGFYDYESKYTVGLTEYIVPAKLPEDLNIYIKELGLKAHKVLGCKCFSRVDMRLSKDNKVFVLEVNTIPGLTKTSLLPKAAEAVGIDFDTLVYKILLSAFEK